MGAFTALGYKFIMGDMNPRHHQIKLPAIFTAGSFLAIFLILILTSPVKNITYAALFFLALMIFLVSLGYLTVQLQAGRVRARDRRRIYIISALLLVLVMFRSAQSLSWVDIVTLLLISSGLLFYSDRRALK